MKRSPEKRHTQTHGNIFQRSLSNLTWRCLHHTFTLFELRNTSVIIKIYQISFCVAFFWRSLHFFMSFSFTIFWCYLYFGTFLSTCFFIKSIRERNVTRTNEALPIYLYWGCHPGEASSGLSCCWFWCHLIENTQVCIHSLPVCHTKGKGGMIK